MARSGRKRWVDGWTWLFNTLCGSLAQFCRAVPLLTLQWNTEWGTSQRSHTTTFHLLHTPFIPNIALFPTTTSMTSHLQFNPKNPFFYFLSIKVCPSSSVFWTYLVELFVYQEENISELHYICTAIPIKKIKKSLQLSHHVLECG